MRCGFGAIAAAGALLATTLGSVGTYAQKSGGILKMPDFASPASMSIHEEATRAAVTPLMGVFNNLVLFDQHVPQNSLASVVPDLAVGWSWDEANTALTFRLDTGVRWHNGKPFTAQDVKCTWDTLAGKSNEKFRLNPRKSWYRNLEEITTNGDDEVTFHLKRPPTLSPRAAGLRRIAGLSLSCDPGADAAAPNRHRSIQIRRV